MRDVDGLVTMTMRICNDKNDLAGIDGGDNGI